MAVQAPGVIAWRKKKEFARKFILPALYRGEKEARLLTQLAAFSVNSKDNSHRFINSFWQERKPAQMFGKSGSGRQLDAAGQPRLDKDKGKTRFTKTTSVHLTAPS